MTHPPQPTSRQQRPHSRAVRSMRTSTVLYSVPEGSRVQLPETPPQSSGRSHTRRTSRTPSQLNTHLEHLFGSPQCYSQRDSIDTLADSYGKLAWNPEELARSGSAMSNASTKSGRSRGGSESPTEKSPLLGSPRSGGSSGHRRKPSSPLKKCEKAFGW